MTNKKMKQKTKEKAFEEMTFEEINKMIRERILNEKRTKCFYKREYQKVYPFKSEDGSYCVDNGYDHHKLIETLNSFLGPHTNSQICFERRSSPEPSAMHRRLDIPDNYQNPKNPGYGRWTYILDVFWEVFLEEEGGRLEKTLLNRTFIGESEEIDAGLGYLYRYNDFEIKNKKKIKLSSANVVRDLFHDVFVHYAKTRL